MQHIRNGKKLAYAFACVYVVIALLILFDNIGRSYNAETYSMFIFPAVYLLVLWKLIVAKRDKLAILFAVLAVLIFFIISFLNAIG